MPPAAHALAAGLIAVLGSCPLLIVKQEQLQNGFFFFLETLVDFFPALQGKLPIGPCCILVFPLLVEKQDCRLPSLCDSSLMNDPYKCELPRPLPVPLNFNFLPRALLHPFYPCSLTPRPSQPLGQKKKKFVLICLAPNVY